ncbi:MAG TPA: PD-(D/E)XK nuclease family protein [Solirubrobacterales bacterium]|nr:PD-(D/E)XK nuclease family protein [Solirubrobacterales bacterium]
MPLYVIKGPPNSGRTEQVRREYVELLPRRPVLVVPSIDDIFDWERRLARERGAFLGGRIMHFKDLVTEVLAVDGTVREVASGVQRRHFVSLAIRSAWPRISERVERQPGLIDAMLDLIDEFRNGVIDPDALNEAITGTDSEYLERIAAVYREYLQLLAGQNLDDTPGLALKATRIRLDAWQGRPIFVAGFDDLTNTQLELLERLAGQTDVTIALTHEVGNPAMAVTEKLLGRLEERLATVRVTTERPEHPIDHAPLLFEIERNFGLGRKGELAPGPALTLMRSSGRRGEAESVAAEIAGLVSGGVDPGRIAIGVSSPALNGPGFRDLLTEYGIPVTLESETPASGTATGQTIISLLRAVSPGGTATDLIAFLRGPVGQDRDVLDQLESGVLRGGLTSASEAAGLYRRLTGEAPPYWGELTTGRREDIPEMIATLADSIGGEILKSGPDEMPGDGVASEAQIATAITRACEDLKKIQGQPLTAADIADALMSEAIMTWAIPTQNTVRIASQSKLRAKRFEHLFLVSLQERAFSDSERAGPFLTMEARNTIGLPDFTDPELHELYLFYSCLSVPTEGLWLSARVADESGKAEYPSPLIGEIEELFDPELGDLRRTDRPSSAITFAADRAPSFDELVRSLAATEPAARSGQLGLLELTDSESAEVRSRIATATDTELSTRSLAELSGPTALGLIAGDMTFSATAIELFLSCPYRWFIERVLRPGRFGPEPEAIARGNLIHGVLAALYAAHPGELPRPENLTEWSGEVEPQVNAFAESPEVNLGSDSPGHRIIRRQAVDSITAYLAKEAERESPGFIPWEMEAEFALEMEGGWTLRGSIDRIDTSGADGIGAGRRGIVIDYKTGKSSVKTRAQIQREKKVQLQLYMHAMRKTWGIEPTAGLYVPIVGGRSAARGIVDAGFAADVSDLNAQTRDREEDLEAAVSDAIAASGRAVEAMMAGRIEHDPATCPNHLNHAAVPDWIPDEEGSPRPTETAGAG